VVLLAAIGNFLKPYIASSLLSDLVGICALIVVVGILIKVLRSSISSSLVRNCFVGTRGRPELYRCNKGRHVNCVCVCVCEREREREGDREGQRD
jgi:hypothetical protein